MLFTLDSTSIFITCSSYPFSFLFTSKLICLLLQSLSISLTFCYLPWFIITFYSKTRLVYYPSPLSPSATSWETPLSPDANLLHYPAHLDLSDPLLQVPPETRANRWRWTWNGLCICSCNWKQRGSNCQRRGRFSRRQVADISSSPSSFCSSRS